MWVSRRAELINAFMVVGAFILVAVVIPWVMPLEMVDVEDAHQVDLDPRTAMILAQPDGVVGYTTTDDLTMAIFHRSMRSYFDRDLAIPAYDLQGVVFFAGIDCEAGAALFVALVQTQRTNLSVVSYVPAHELIVSLAEQDVSFEGEFSRDRPCLVEN